MPLYNPGGSFTPPQTLTGTTDAIQLKVKGNATQTGGILDVATNADGSLLRVMSNKQMFWGDTSRGGSSGIRVDPADTGNTIYNFSGGIGINCGAGEGVYAGSGFPGLRVGGSGIGFNNTAPIARPAVTGSRGGNAALADLLTQLAAYGLITDSTTA